ncbi:MAG TPA: AraC family transcriptional regulator [Puia sp.]|nr:AraC family transcriptional regulator [Puia sp.]
MKESLSRYHKLPLCDGLEALYVTQYNTPFPFHYHPTFNISLIYEGIFPTQLNDRFITAAPGNILITNPGEIHANPCEKRNSISFFTFYLGQDFLTHCNEGRAVLFTEKAIYDPGLFDRLHRLSLEIHNGDLRGDFEERLVKTFHLLAVKYGSSRDAGENIKTTTLFREFLAEDHLLKFSLPDAAKRFGMDKFKFLRLFKSQTGLTPNNYFILKRIEKSKALLTEGHDLLSIAIELGFYDAAHFCNHFSKFTGISPRAYTRAD